MRSLLFSGANFSSNFEVPIEFFDRHPNQEEGSLKSKMNWVASSRKMNWVAESGKNWFQSTKNINWSESTGNWFERIENMDWFEIFKNWFESIKNWFEEMEEKGMSDDAWNFIIVGAGMVLLLVAAVICVRLCGWFCFKIILSVIGQAILFILFCCWVLVKAIGLAVKFILRCCWVLLQPVRWGIIFILKFSDVQLMRAPGLAVTIPTALFLLIGPRIWFIWVLSGGDHIDAGTVIGKLEGERKITLGFVDLLRDDYIGKDRSRHIYFTQDRLLG
ncbi:hypothetical protein QN277_024895 [Acacia crassicarpa]|uniref:Ribulose bisphosphate carboxylase large subunit C-terminal domain-containing protein n=1 Tax=Acacia crassicarpa TaxID=499986 RepID=A0AAE1MK17_9FABA|nr:hypothetical protein QN277_024895 [Acacia crassicarpa]